MKVKDEYLVEGADHTRWRVYSSRTPLDAWENKWLLKLSRRSPGMELPEVLAQVTGLTAKAWVNRLCSDVVRLTGERRPLYSPSSTCRELYYFFTFVLRAVDRGHMYYDPVRGLFFVAPVRYTPDDVLASIVTEFYRSRAPGSSRQFASMNLVVEEIGSIYEEIFNGRWRGSFPYTLHKFAADVKDAPSYDSGARNIPARMYAALLRLARRGILRVYPGKRLKVSPAVAGRSEAVALLHPDNAMLGALPPVCNHNTVLAHLDDPHTTALWSQCAVSDALSLVIEDVKERLADTSKVESIADKKERERREKLQARCNTQYAIYMQADRAAATKRKSPGRPKRDYKGVPRVKAVPLKIKDKELKKLNLALEALKRWGVSPYNRTAIEAHQTMLDYDVELLAPHYRIYLRHGRETGNVIRMAYAIESAVASIYSDNDDTVLEFVFTALVNTTYIKRGVQSPLLALKLIAVVHKLRERYAPNRTVHHTKVFGWPISIYFRPAPHVWENLQKEHLLAYDRKAKTLTCLQDPRPIPYHEYLRAAGLQINLDEYPELAALVAAIEKE